MEPFGVIIPHQPGPRDFFLPHAIMQISRQSLKPDVIIIESEPPKTDEIDLVPRIWQALRKMQEVSIDWVFIIENDDYYPDTYFADMYRPGYDIIGIPTTIYYHLGQRAWKEMEHWDRSSLFCTSFRISAFKKFLPDPKTAFLDIDLWKFADMEGLVTRMTIPAKLPVGIKHGIGNCGGSGHSMNFPYDNPDMLGKALPVFIEREESLEFYKKIQRTCMQK